MHRLRATLVLAALLGCGAVPQASAGDLQLSSDLSAANLSAYGGTIAWSTKTGPHANTLELTTAGVRTAAPIPPSTEPFDATLGPGPSGGVVAVYDRCSPRCAMHELVLSTGAESTITAPGTPRGCTAESPSIWKREIAFVRTAIGHSCAQPGLYVLNGSKAQRLAGARLGSDTAITQGVAAFVISGASRDQQDVLVEVVPLHGARAFALYDFGNGRAGFPANVASLSFDQGYLYWDTINYPDSPGTGIPGAWIYRARPKLNVSCQMEHRFFQLYTDQLDPLLPGAIEGLLNSTAVDGATFYYDYADTMAPTPVGGVFEATAPPAKFGPSFPGPSPCADGTQYGDV